MAIICSNFLLGNDTTGNGSSSLPYKTINKALSVAIDNDEVRVAGNQFTQMAGTGTVTARATTITTSVNLTGSIAVGDTIGLDADDIHGFGYEKTLFVVSAITATTITIASNFYSATGTYNIWKFGGYHYLTATTTLQETFAAFTASIVNVTGGWNSTFTTQIGMTGIRYSGGGAAGSAGGFTSWGTGALIKPNVVFDKFLCVNTPFVLSTTAGSIGINNITFLRCATTFGTTNFGVYAPDGGYVNLVSCDSILNTAWNNGSNRPTSLDMIQTVSGGVNPLTFTFVTNIKIAQSTVGVNSPIIKTLTAKVRTCSNITTNTIQSIFAGGIGGSGDIYVDNLYIYICGASTTGLLGPQAFLENAWRYIGDINVTRLDNTRCGIAPFVLSNTFLATTPMNVNRTSGSLDELPWITSISPTTYSQFSKSGISAIYGRDTEGYKVINNDIIVKYADTSTFVTGNNSLRLRMLTNISGVDETPYICATMIKPSTNFTLTIKAKASKSISVTSVKLLYGPAATQDVVLSGISLTTSFQDFTFSITPGSYTNWTFADDGLMSIFLICSAGIVTETETEYIWVDSVTVS